MTSTSAAASMLGKSQKLTLCQEERKLCTTEGPDEILSSNGWDGLVLESSKKKVDHSVKKSVARLCYFGCVMEIAN